MKKEEVIKAVKSLINKEIKQCPNCASSNFSLFESVIWNDVAITYKICNFCSLVFQSPQMDASNTDLFYEKWYRLYNQGNEMPNDLEIDYQTRRAEFLANRVKEFINKYSQQVNCLDIGCSSGLLLETIKHKYPRINKLFGVEPGDAYRDFAKTKGIIVYSSIDDLSKNESEKIEFITMSHVLEHISNPVDFLKFIRKQIISDNGTMMIEVPNFYGAHAYEFSHNVCFTSKTLEDTIRLAGFEIVDLITHANPNNTIRPLYLNIIIKPGKSIEHPPKYASYKVRVMRKYAPTRESHLTTRLLKIVK
jgi:hypothetical protein